MVLCHRWMLILLRAIMQLKCSNQFARSCHKSAFKPNLCQKIFYTKGTLRGKFYDWLKSLSYIVIDWEFWIKKWVNNLGCTEEKGDGKDIHCSAQNAMLFVDL